MLSNTSKLNFKSAKIKSLFLNENVQKCLSCCSYPTFSNLNSNSTSLNLNCKREISFLSLSSKDTNTRYDHNDLKFKATATPSLSLRSSPKNTSSSCSWGSQSQQLRFYTNRNILTLKSRGLISDFFPSDSKEQFVNLCNGNRQTLYAGFDPTADSLHVGNLAVIMMLLQAHRGGHNIIALIGGATGRIGDPSGKSSERNIMDKESVASNSEKIGENVKRVFENHAKYFWNDKKGTEPLPEFRIVNNFEWYSKMSSLDFVGKVGRHFRMGTMLLKDSVKTRLASDEGMSFTEFTYQIFQAYDFYRLFKAFDCRIQVGGHDQMGNIWAGHELISRRLRKQVYGITVPLVTTETGNKYGKSAGNAVWLDQEKTSAFDLYQFFIRSADNDLQRLFNIFTFRTEKEIESILKKHEREPETRHGQKELAQDVTLLVHGEEGLATALKATEALYSENLEALSSLRVEDIQKLFRKPAGGESHLAEVYLQPGTTVLDMALKARCFDNPKDATRIIQAGGFFLNYRKVSNLEEMIVPGIHILPNNISLARVGKRNYYVIKWLP